MCLCNKTRAASLVRRNKAHYLDDSQTVIQLNYTPKGLGKYGRGLKQDVFEFFTQERQNICVVCGSQELLTKHHVVPYCFLKYFPVKYKEHIDYDILPVCATCHDQYELVATLLKESLRKQHVPPSSLSDRVAEGRAYCAAISLANHSRYMPADRIQELKSRIAHVYGDKSLEDIITNHRPESRWCVKSQDWKYVVEAMGNPGDISKYWRQHFLDVMKPRFLPRLWSAEGPLCDISCIQNNEHNHEIRSFN